MRAGNREGDAQFWDCGMDDRQDRVLVLDNIKRHSFYEAVAVFVTRYNLFNGIEHVYLAYSGGADSTALLAFLAVWKEAHNIHVTAHHIQHGLRKSDGLDAEVAEINARRLGIPFVLTQLKLGCVLANIEAEARKARIEALESVVKASGIENAAIVTAHHGDENIETALWRMGRGCGIEGATLAMRSDDSIPRIRPLLCLGKREILAFLRDIGLPWAEDPTNATDHYRRNRLRHHVLDQLMDEFETMRPFYRSLIQMRCDGDALDSLVEASVMRYMFGHRWVFPLSQFEALSAEALTQLLRHAARHIVRGYCPDAQFIEQTRVMFVAKTESKKIATNQKIDWTWNRFFVMGKPHGAEPELPASVEVPVPVDNMDIWEMASASSSRMIFLDVPKNTRTKLCLDASVCLGALRFVPACLTERMVLTDGRCPKIMELLAKSGIPDVCRYDWPVLMCEQEPWWIFAGPRSIYARPPVRQQMAYVIEMKCILF